eukprot:2856589-Rhodomonas_salina.1
MIIATSRAATERWLKTKQKRKLDKTPPQQKRIGKEGLGRPEDASELEDTLEAADDKALEVQLCGDAHVQLHVQRVVVRDEWLGLRSACTQSGSEASVLAAAARADGGWRMEGG